MSYKRWRPSSRRDRRRNRRSRRGAARGAEKTFFVFAGLFFLVLILILAALALFGG